MATNRRTVQIQFGKLNKRTKRAVKVTLSRHKMKRFMQILSILMRRRTLLGNFTDENKGKRMKLKPLADSTIAQRAGKQIFWTDANGRIRTKKGKFDVDLSDKTNPRKSNLTRTGQMLMALKGIGLGFARGAVFVAASQRKETKLTNKAVSKFAAEGGRPFLNITKQESKNLAQRIKKDLVKQLKK